MRAELQTATDEDLVELARTGENERAIEMLLKRYRHYARAKARSYFLSGADKDDIVQEGMIGLYKAIRDYQASKNIAFRAFAELCITRQIITAIKTATRQKHQPLNSYVSLSRGYAASGEGDRALVDVLVTDHEPDPADVVIDSEEMSVIRSSMGRVLSNFESQVMQLYVEGKSYQQIADMLGKHAKSIDNALQRIKRKLAAHIGGRATPAE
ncbi:MAG: RNA polymerase sporulation sigma factor SigH [Actinobacteria bacterium]|nr:RNA polymerase sporulation sigma factor SigH [Actinomycetota bacterium]